MRSPFLRVLFFVMLISLCDCASAGISYDSTKIYISGGAYNLTNVYTTVNNTNVIASEGNGVWLLKYPISVSAGGTLYINSSDTTWLKMVYTNTTFFTYLKNQGSMYIDGVKITSWNTSTNSVINSTNTSDPRPYILFSTTTGVSSLKDTNASYLGYSGGTYATGVDCNDPANNTTISGCTFIRNRVGLLIDEHNTTVTDCYISNSSSYGLQIVNSVSPIYGVRVTNVTSEYNDGVNIFIKPYTTTGTLYNAVFDRCKSRYGPGNLYNLVYLHDSIVRNCEAYQTGRNNDWHSGFDLKTNCDNVTIENCTAGNCQNAFYIHNYDTNITLKNCTAYNSDTEFSISAGSKYCRVENCTAYGENTTDSGAGFSGHSGSNNIFLNCTAYDVYWGGNLQPLNWTVVDGTMSYVPEFSCYNNSFIGCNFSGSAYDYNLAPSGQAGIDYGGINNIIDAGSISLSASNTSAIRTINSFQNPVVSGVKQYYYPNISVRNALGQLITGASLTTNRTVLNGYGQSQTTFRVISGKTYDSGNRSNWLAAENNTITMITASKYELTNSITVNPNLTYYSIDPSNLQGPEMVLTLGIVTPSSNFTSNVTGGIQPCVIQFNDTSTDSPTSWAWDFGDGNTSMEQNPTHNYTIPGVYNVTLTTSNDDGSNTKTVDNYITIEPSEGPSMVTFYSNNTVNSTVDNVIIRNNSIRFNKDNIWYNMSLQPNNHINITIVKWNVTGDYIKIWNESSNVAETSTNHSIAGYPINTFIDIYRDGVGYTSVKTNSNGVLDWTYNGGYSTHIFETRISDTQISLNTADVASGAASIDITITNSNGMESLYTNVTNTITSGYTLAGLMVLVLAGALVLKYLGYV